MGAMAAGTINMLVSGACAYHMQSTHEVVCSLLELLFIGCFYFLLVV
jgi:hypothetical protein